MNLQQRIGLIARVEDDHVYLQADAPVHWIWIGRRPHIEALDDEQVMMLIRYRIAFESAHCLGVH